MEKINIEKAWEDYSSYLFVDTRSPAEFEEDHVPRSYNLPIFDDTERKNIGILYKADKQKAFDLGIDYYSKKLPGLVKEIRKLPRNKKIIVYCWRGGLRSKAIAQLIDLLGYSSYQLEGGYKAYRAFVRENLYKYQTDFRFIVLWGLTGTAKTKIIKRLKPAIDLEGLAQHRSSLFGAVGLNPRSQKYFESLLYFELEKLKGTGLVFIEGESKKIGDVIIPSVIYNKMKNGVKVRIESSLKARVKNTVKEYFLDENVEQIKSIIPLLKQKLGTKRVNELLQWMQDKNYENVSEVLLTEYYDPLYRHTIDRMDYDYEIKADSITKHIEKLNSIRSELLINSKKFQ
ncbi:MAG: tRNA 2-selenouridine(34) synthase MnmH [Nanoarchaeota archaeon]